MYRANLLTTDLSSHSFIDLFIELFTDLSANLLTIHRFIAGEIK